MLSMFLYSNKELNLPRNIFIVRVVNILWPKSVQFEKNVQLDLNKMGLAVLCYMNCKVSHDGFCCI